MRKGLILVWEDEMPPKGFLLFPSYSLLPIWQQSLPSFDSDGLESSEVVGEWMSQWQRVRSTEEPRSQRRL